MRLCLAIALVLLYPSLGPAQVVSQGADGDSVLRAYGAPRARSATRNREIWTYPDFQVVFENGRMLAISKRDDLGTRVEWGTAATPDASTPGSVATPRDPAANGGAPMTLTVEAGKRVLRSPARPSPNAEESAGWAARVMRALGLVLIVACVVAAAGWLVRRKWRNGGARGLLQEVTKPALPTLAPAKPTPEAGASRLSPSEPYVGKPPSLSDWEIPLDLLRSIEWKRFELLVERFYAASGFQTKVTSVGADDGVNLFLYRRGAKRPFSCVQCKAWGEPRVELSLVRELFDEMASRGIAEGVIVTSGDFTPDAVAFAGRNRITLLSGTAFMIRFNRMPILARERIIRDVTAGDYTTPSCPRCASKLELRDSAAAGTPVWGCRRYPVCRYTMKVPGSAESVAG